MDLLSLPDEMLVSVYKYTNDPTLTKSKRISSKIDQIVVRNKLNKVSLKELYFVIGDQDIEVIIRDFHRKEIRLKVVFNEATREDTMVAFVLNIFEKIRYTKVFEISGQNYKTGRSFSLPNKVISNMIENSKGKRISQFCLDSLILQCNASLIRKLLTTFKFECLRIIYCKARMFGQHSSLFNGLTFNTLILSKIIRMSINDLETIYKTEIPEFLEVTCRNVNLKDAVQLLEDLLERKRRRLTMYLNDIDFGRMTEKEIQTLLRPLEAVTYVDIYDKFILIKHDDWEVDIVFGKKLSDDL